MKDNMNKKGVIILIALFLIFYLVTSHFLEQRKINKFVPDKDEVTDINNENYDNEKAIVNNLYSTVKVLYYVVNNKFIVSHEDMITIGDTVYKKITNFDEVMNDVFTKNGQEKYLSDLSSYFAIMDDDKYLIANLVSYQTQYFYGDMANIYITDVFDNEIKGIIYEKKTSNDGNTLATVRVVKEDGKWLVDDITILATE